MRRRRRDWLRFPMDTLECRNVRHVFKFIFQSIGRCLESDECCMLLNLIGGTNNLTKCRHHCRNEHAWSSVITTIIIIIIICCCCCCCRGRLFLLRLTPLSFFFVHSSLVGSVHFVSIPLESSLQHA